jgi:hypothetical protein
VVKAVSVASECSLWVCWTGAIFAFVQLDLSLWGVLVIYVCRVPTHRFL